jgi:Family of unknown function (DUF6288)/PA14 domain/Bacterial Ig domain
LGCHGENPRLNDFHTQKTMKTRLNLRNSFIVLRALIVSLALVTGLQAAPPDLTSAGAIAALKAGTLANAYPGFGETYNLGATGLRGWIYLSTGWGTTHGADGTMSGESRQILVTVAEAPGNAVLAVDDVILGAMAASSGTVPTFSSDARKAFGAAIGDAEKTGAGTLRVKRWRAGTTTDVNIAMTIMGDYTATGPYSCAKSSLIFANARNHMVVQLLADPNFLTGNWAGGISGLALLASVAPGDPNYTTVQTRLQTFARALAASPPATSDYSSVDTWSTGYLALFLGEYYLSTGDAQVVAGLNTYILALAKAQSRYGTYGHAGSLLKADGSLHGTIPPYGPVNAAAIPANIAIVVGKKALLAASQPIDPEIDPAIQRGSDFYAWYVNKGPIPYGEHEPFIAGHSSNGKDPMCAVLFGLQPDRTAETEYFSRMTTASFIGREYGHSGQGFSYLWSAMGANMGGPLAVAEYLKPVRWHLDLSRRTDGSFGYDGAEQYGGGSTANGTYLGTSSYHGMNSTAPYLLTLSLPLQRLYITGKNAIPANTLDSTKVANAVAAATCQLDAPGFTNSQLIANLSEYDPVVRHYSAIELGKRTLNSTELSTLRGMVSNMGDANGRMGACQALGLLKDATALPIITQRLDKNLEPNSWVRAKAASAIREYPAATASAHRDTMLTAYAANATDPEVIVWDDPVQISNNYLSFALFENIASYTINAPKNLLYPAVKAGLKQPDSNSRSGAAYFCYNNLTLADVQALTLDIIEVITTKSQADTMWSADPQISGLGLLAKYNCAEAVPMAVSMLNVKKGWAWNFTDKLTASKNVLLGYGDSARWTMPLLEDNIEQMRAALVPWDFAAFEPTLLDAIAGVDAATTSPAGVIHLLPLATPQVVTTIGAKAITLTGTSPRGAVTFTNVTAPAHGTLTGTAPNLTYTPNGGYTGPDHFTFQVVDSLTTSEPATVAILVGTPGTGLKGEYFDNSNFTNLKLTRTDAQVNFDWGTGSPHASIGADTFSARWSGVLLVPETGTYTFSTLNSDGARLYINGVPVINQFSDQSTNWNDSTPLALTEGQLVDIQLDYYENTGSAVAKLKWTGPSFAGVNGDIIGSQWIFDGTGMNRAPYAFPQSLTVLMNQPKAITLTGSGGNLTYSVVTPPAHGTLTGTAPYLTYTPTASYIGLDSFTFKTNNGTTDSAPATISLDVIPANTFSVNFYANGGLTTPEAQANLLINPGMSAGLPDSFTYGWTNILVPWNPPGPQAPATLTSNQGSTATFVFKDCRNGGPYDYSIPRTTQLGNGNGNLMDGHVNSTLDGPYPFDMEVTGIPFAVYDVIFYIGANKDQFGDGTGVIKFNGGADRAFKLKPGAFDGNFTEMVDATTPGNYIVFSGVTGSSFTTQTWGTGPYGFNHIGPCGFQIREAFVPDTTPPTLNGTSIVDDNSGAPVVQDTVVNYTVTFSEDMDAGTVSAADFGNAGTSAVAIGAVSETSPGVFTVAVTPTSAGTLQLRVNAGAVLNDVAGNALITTSAITDDTTLTVTTNTAPVANSQNVSTPQNTAKPITLTATDAEGNPLTYTIVSQPANGTLSGTAPSVVYTPSSNYTGADSFTFKVNDGILDSATATVSITVSPLSPITWGTAAAITSAANIQGTGVNSLAGANFGITTGTTTIVPAAETGTVDVEFRSLSSGQNVTLSNGINVAASADWGNWGFSSSNSAVTGNFGTVLDSNLGIETDAPASPSATITLSGLTIGTQYQIQFFADSTGSNSQTISDGGTINSLDGQFVTGTFTADATTRVLTVTRNTDFAVANAITIAKVGAPKVWNVNIGGDLTTSDNFVGAAPENTANSFWNSLGNTNLLPLVDSTGAAGTATVQLGVVGGTLGFTSNGGYLPKIFTTWCKHTGNTLPVAVTFGGLSPAGTYDLIVYADWYWQTGAGVPITQTTGTGMSSTVTLNNFADAVGTVHALVEDSDLANNTSIRGNWLRITGLTPSAGGILGFDMNGRNSPLSGFQLIQTSAGTTDTTPPTLAGSSIVDDQSGGPVNTNTLVTYTVSFNEDMDATTVSAADFGNAGTSAVTIGTVNETSPGVFAVPVTPTSAGTLQLQVNAGAVLNDAAGNALDTTVAVTDNTTLTVTVPNTAPVANAQSPSTPEDTALPITLTATDAEANPLTYTVLTQPSNGTLNGTAPNLTYTPAANSSGPDSFTFKANDGLLDSAVATVDITVTPVNDAPVANAQSGVTTAEDSPTAITLTGSDVEGSALTYTVVTQPTNGTLSGTAPNLTYTPAPNDNGSRSFTFKVNDGEVDSAIATVSITVTPVNDAPVATPQSVSTAHNTAKAITLQGTDVEGSALTYAVATQPTRGTLSGTAPNLTYTPTSGTSGPDSFTFKVHDGTVDSATATVSISVALPLPWTNGNIGTGMLAGSVTTSSGTFTQAGSGTVGSTGDKLHYTYQTLTGDGEIIARISALQNTGTSSRVGVMIRDTLAANSKSIFMGMSDTGTYRWVRRTTTGGNSTTTASSTGTVPNTWVRLVRAGTTITAYKSTNGTSWTSVGSTKNTTFASTCYIGLAVASGSTTTLNTSQFSSVTVTP